MKSIIVGVLVFLLALGGGSFLSISKAKSAAAELAAQAESTEGEAATGGGADTGEGGGSDEDPDGAATGSDPEGTPAVADPTEGEPAPGDDPAGGATQFAAADLTEEGAVEGDEGPSVPASELGGSDPAGDLNPEGIRRMARIFTAMKPKDAAAVLERMTDVEVQGVMLQMGDRAAAGILSVFDPERAAVLSQIVLGRRGAP